MITHNFFFSGNIVKEKRFDLRYPPNFLSFVLALICGFTGSYGFAFASHINWMTTDTTLILSVVAFIASTQFALSMLRSYPLKVLPIALIASGLMGGIYGLNVYLIEAFLKPMQLMHPQPLNFIHFIGLVLLVFSWLSILFGSYLYRFVKRHWILKFYVKVLNASQPHPDTITAHRNHYKYL